MASYREAMNENEHLINIVSRHSLFPPDTEAPPLLIERHHSFFMDGDRKAWLNSFFSPGHFPVIEILDRLACFFRAVS